MLLHEATAFIYSMYPIVEIFGKQIGSYTICAIVGVAVCMLVGYLMVRKEKGFCIDDLIVSAVSIIIGLVFGGHIIFGITNIPQIISLFQHISDYDFLGFMTMLFGQYIGGMVFYGGMLGGIAGLTVCCKVSQFGHKYMFDMYAVCIPLFHVFGRIGCFLGGCCYGIESEFGFTVHGNTLNPSVNDVNRFPVQLVEAACNLMIFVILFALHKKGKFHNRLLIAYFYLYPVVRFILEFFRGDEIRGFLFGLSTSQIISILLFAFAIIFTVIDVNKKKGSIQTETA